MVDYYDAKWKIKVVEEIRRWSHDVLQVPSDHFGGLAPCPYAQAAWANNKVKVDFGGVDTVLQHTKEWDDRVDLVIVVLHKDVKFDTIEPWCEYQNDMLAKDDFALMPFVPGSGVGTGQPEEEATDWDPIVEEDYAMVFVQRLSDVNEASESLEHSGYYKNCTAEFMEYVKDRRERERYARQQQEEGHGEEEEVVRLLQEREGHREGYVSAGEDAGQEEGQQEEQQEDAARSACGHEEEGR